MFYRSDSYGYLQEFTYKKNLLSLVKIYPILAGSIDYKEEIIRNKYYYMDDKLKVYNDYINDRVHIVDRDSVLVISGILNSSRKFLLRKEKIDEYYFIYLN